MPATLVMLMGLELKMTASTITSGRIKGPILRGLSARPRTSTTLRSHTTGRREVLESRFGLALTPEEESDLVAFLRFL